MKAALPWMFAALLLAGCASDPPPRPQAPVNAIFVSRGDTVYGISRVYRIPLRDLIEANGLQPPYALSPGQRLVLPTVQDYTVQAGDTLYAVARAHQVDMSTLVRFNNLQPPYALSPGQVLRLPGRSPAASAVAQAGGTRRPDATTTPPSRATRPSVETAELPPPSSPSAPAAASPATPPTSSRQSPPAATTTVTTAPAAGSAVVGKKGVETEALPPPGTAPAASASTATGGTGTAGSGTASSGTASSGTVVTPPSRPAPADSPQAEPPPQVAAAPSTTPPAAPVQAAPKPPPGKGFIWPVQGPILSDYGPKPGGLRNDGINIGAALGTPVMAAESGTVVFAGNQVKSFGNLILIRHADGWVTVYGYLDQMSVTEGQKVTRGQTIGTVGQTGNVVAPQLHFSIRKGEQPVDPKQKLGS
ncbi:peptidoglycan DD-metalloendopeptidase family protein [Oleisolibacter albus]|uniref:peptidoglycan DD-metalloendopeptidase family protein n=1 Tax=Oleisolibacter albus TaxID=2171757 RepID=UPI0013901538|nr:peptidoglycan DD-metalloendopeptidase family protein [Oleisolibacter albus]